MKKKEAVEFFYRDNDGKRQDSVLHEAILQDGDIETAKASSVAVMRRQGFSEYEINLFLHGKNPKKKMIEVRRKSGDEYSFMQECIEVLEDEGHPDAEYACQLIWDSGEDEGVLEYRNVTKHKPGGHDHDQSTHGGDRGGGADDYDPNKFPASELLATNYEKEEPLTIEQIKAKLSPEFKAKEAEALEAMKGMEITSRQFLGDDGKYVPERAELHRKIIRELFTPDAIAKATPASGVKPTLTLSGGRPAAGKTSSLKKELQSKIDTSFYINADEIQEKLPGYKGMLAGIYNGEAQDVALMAEKVARHMGLNIIYDATLKSKQPALERVANYKAAGYDVDGYFVHTTPQTSVIRSSERFMRDPDGKGRYLPPEISFNSKTNEATFDALIPELRNWVIYDNNGDKPKRIAGNI